MIVIDGRLQRRDYEKDGVKHQNVFINVENAYFGDSKNETGTHAAQGQTASTSTPTPAPAPAPVTDVDGFMDMLPDDDGLPFM